MSPRGDRLQRELPAEDTDSPASLMVAYKPQNDAEFSTTLTQIPGTLNNKQTHYSWVFLLVILHSSVFKAVYFKLHVRRFSTKIPHTNSFTNKLVWS